MNLLEDIALGKMARIPLQWEHAPEKWETLPGGGLRVYVPPKVDYFQDPAGKLVKDDAPYLWASVTGDFVARAHVRPTFTTTYDAGAVMARHDAQHWAKMCYESTDLGSTAAVSVVTNGVSDDANGADLTAPDVWLQVVRAGDVFGLHYALDGRNWRMVRLFRLALPAEIQIGLVAQCPIGPGATIDFLHFSLEPRTINNLRTGI